VRRAAKGKKGRPLIAAWIERKKRRVGRLLDQQPRGKKSALLRPGGEGNKRELCRSRERKRPVVAEKGSRPGPSASRGQGGGRRKNTCRETVRTGRKGRGEIDLPASYAAANSPKEEAPLLAVCKRGKERNRHLPPASIMKKKICGHSAAGEKPILFRRL